MKLRPQILFCLTLPVTFLSLAGQGWVPAGPDQIPVHIGHGAMEGVGRIDCMAFHPADTNTFWVGTPTGGLWKTTDNCSTWSTYTDHFSSLGISDIEVHPFGPDTLFLSTGDRDAHRTFSTGVYKSVDGGESWDSTGLFFSLDEEVVLHNLVLLPDHPEIQLATGTAGIYRTENSWATFEKVQEGNFNDMEIHPTRSSHIYAVLNNPEGNSAIYVSGDSGRTFQVATGGMEGLDAVSRIELAVTRAQEDLVYAVCSRTDGTLHGFYRSVDRSGSWTQMSASIPNLLGNNCDGIDNGGTGNYALTIAVSPSDADEVFVGGNHLWKSFDGGDRWEAVTGWCGTAVWLLQKHHELEYSSEGIIFTSTEGGIYRTRDKGESWEKLSSNLSILQINNMAISGPHDPMILLGTNYNGVIKKDGDQWYFIEGVGHNAYRCLIDHQDAGTLYVVKEYGSILKSTDRGRRFTSIQPAEAGLGARSAPLVKHPVYSGVLFAGFKEIYKTVDGGSTWFPVSGFGNGEGEELLFLQISLVDHGIIYAANLKKIWKTTDGGEHWQKLPLELEEGEEINALLCSPNDPARIWAGLAVRKGAGSVLASRDGGSSWERMSEGLPDGPVNCLAYEKNSNRVIYAGTDRGVYVWNSVQKQWNAFKEGLPTVIVSDLQIDSGRNKLMAATYGRGVWESKLYTEPILLPYPEFLAGQRQSCGGSEIQFESISMGIISSYAWNFGEGAEPATARGEGPHLVKYFTRGEKSVSLTINDSITELKKGYVHVVDDIDIKVFPEGGCFTGPVLLNATGAADYTWAPDAGLSAGSGSTVTASPLSPSEYVVTGELGSCTDSTTVSLAIVFDDICNAFPLEFGENGPFTNLCASVEINEPGPLQGSEGNGCFSQDGWCMREVLNNTVWFSFIPDASGTVSVETRGDFNNQIALFESPSCSDILNQNYQILAANDDQSLQRTTAVIKEVSGLSDGKTYWLMVDGGKKGETGEFSIILRNEGLTGTGAGLADPGLELNLYPNPSGGEFTIELPGMHDFQASVEVFNAQGALVYVVQGVWADRDIPVNMESCIQGIYHLKVRMGDKIYHKKIVIE